MPETNYCGKCKHWHEHGMQKYKNCRTGDCDKIPKGTVYQDGKDHAGFPFTYDGYSFEDECYDECMNCFEPREGE